MNGNVSCCYATLDAKHLVWHGGKPVARVPRQFFFFLTHQQKEKKPEETRVI